jgi:NAD dependent epimerase/dehydratase family enzyme
VYWDPDAGRIDAARLEGFDAVIQLASMHWPMRWTRKVKAKLRANRVATYRLLADSLAACARKPRVLVCASGIGVYPASGDELLTEDTPPCPSFVSAVDRDGETATAAAGQRYSPCTCESRRYGGPALQYAVSRRATGGSGSAGSGATSWLPSSSLP